MDFIEYIEKTCNIKLFDYQKEFLRKYDQAQKEGKRLIFNPVRAGCQRYLYLVGLYHTIKEQGGEKKECKINTSTG